MEKHVESAKYYYWKVSYFHLSTKNFSFYDYIQVKWYISKINQRNIENILYGNPYKLLLWNISKKVGRCPLVCNKNIWYIFWSRQHYDQKIYFFDELLCCTYVSIWQVGGLWKLAVQCRLSVIWTWEKSELQIEWLWMHHFYFAQKSFCALT